jgi:hypothetical protein
MPATVCPRPAKRLIIRHIGLMMPAGVSAFGGGQDERAGFSVALPGPRWTWECSIEGRGTSTYSCLPSPRDSGERERVRGLRLDGSAGLLTPALSSRTRRG